MYSTVFFPCIINFVILQNIDQKETLHLSKDLYALSSEKC